MVRVAAQPPQRATTTRPHSRALFVVSDGTRFAPDTARARCETVGGVSERGPFRSADGGPEPGAHEKRRTTHVTVSNALANPPLTEGRAMRLETGAWMLMLMCAGGSFAAAQETTSTITGRTIDAQGLAVPGVVV